MSEQDPEQAGGGEPSMEDILASIRRILAEDGAMQTAEPQIEPEAAPSKPAPLAAQKPPVSSAVPPADVAPSEPPLPKRRLQPFDDDAFANAFNPYDDEEDVFVLTPEMRIEVAAGSIGGERVVSERTAASSTDVLSQLASAILDRRDIAVSTREVTLEGMVREMLRPLLREWLDRNLPYLIERLVKREIDMMINRAERLED